MISDLIMRIPIVFANHIFAQGGNYTTPQVGFLWIALEVYPPPLALCWFLFRQYFDLPKFQTVFQTEDY